MKKYFLLVSIFCLLFASISYANNDATYRDLQVALGTLKAGYINRYLLSEIPENEVLTTQMWYPEKLGVFQKYERVEIVKLSHDKWRIQNPETEGTFEFSVAYENSQIKILKINSTPPTKQPNIQPADVTSDKHETPYYIAFKGGVYHPTDDLEDFDDGFYGEISLNSYFSKYLAFEIGVGYFETEYKANGFILGIPYSEKDDIYAIPMITNVKGIVPLKFGELFLGAGVSGYYVHGDVDVNIPGVISVSGNADDYIFGAQFLGGLNINITDTLILGLEGKYIITQDADLDGIEFNLNGFIATGVLGFRF